MCWVIYGHSCVQYTDIIHHKLTISKPFLISFYNEIALFFFSYKPNSGNALLLKSQDLICQTFLNISIHNNSMSHFQLPAWFTSRIRLKKDHLLKTKVETISRSRLEMKTAFGLCFLPPPCRLMRFHWIFII